MHNNRTQYMTPFQDLSGHELKFLNRLVEHLFSKTNTGIPITTRYEQIDDNRIAYATVEDAGMDDKYIIVIDNRLDFGTVCDYLVCMFAGVKMRCVEEADYGPHFGVEWARLYHVYMELYHSWFD